MKFDASAGHEVIKQLLRRTADREQLPNSYLFAGSEGVGKWAMALALAAYVNCREPQDGDSCGLCPSCIQINKLQHSGLYIAIPTPPSKSESEEHENFWEILNGRIEEPYMLIGGKRQMSIPIARVREIQRSVSQTPSATGRRVIIIDQMERMLTQSADALLKLIEEPPSRTLVIITTARPDKLLPTIISRCRRVKFPNLAEMHVEEYLMQRLQLEPQTAHLWARLSRGSIGRALYLADETFSSDRRGAMDLFAALFTSSAATVVATAADQLPFNDRSRLIRVLAVWQSLIRDLLILLNNGPVDELINIDFQSELRSIAAGSIVPEHLYTAPRDLAVTMHDIELNVEPKAAVCAALARLHGCLSTAA